ncbi:transglutaminase domain-containing protein [Breznakiella homolactica]|uniref:Transglutaminase-like domain-containing protein n=1 Tax=Breznakiella homolactica TaxID=2798577 RepID=A0A7T8BAZ5_9SPIR|nr:transglutaminase domain-containing protein [Breznakiella homolactica]QQO10007.1 hypothetical protein JFL75_03580 [Breznakiella homolactica]
MPVRSRPSTAAFIVRSAALLGILYQFRLIAGDLADTSFFLINVLFALGAAWTLEKQRLPVLPAVFVLVLIPWVARLFITVPGFFRTGNTVFFDSLLLGMDRNNFVSLVPYYWASLTSYFACRSRSFLRGDIIASDALLLVIFSAVKTSEMELYRMPVTMILVFGGILFLQMIALILTTDPVFRVRRMERVQGILAVLALVFIGGLLLIKPSEERAVNQGGGLLQPNLFKFDFSQFLRLESEISLNDDLVLIVRKDPEDFHLLLRRFVLSGYGPKKGFFLDETRDEAIHPQRLPDSSRELSHEETIEARFTDQEYFLVNFDASAFIALNQPVSVTPFRTWDASSFKSAYAVRSRVSEAMPFELIDSVRGEPGPGVLGLSPEEYAYYTDYGGDQRIAEYARELTGNVRGYWDQIQMVYERLKYGEYRYSLKPGIAPDGDQLGYFLFESKKGYCSYFAFSMTLLLRSLGIPARVAVGFFVDPETNTFDYFPVRSDMAHAWVEVRYPGYGWIEYDPTTNFLAEGEEYRFSEGTSRDLFERLMREILQNRSGLQAKDTGEDDSSGSSLAALGRKVQRFLRRSWVILVLFGYVLVCILMRSGSWIASMVSKNPRKKSSFCWIHAKRRLALAGYRRSISETDGEWSFSIDGRAGLGLYRLYQAFSAARFSPQYGRDEWRQMRTLYTVFSGNYRGLVPWYRRALAWLLPPLSLVLPPKKNSRSAGPRSGGTAFMVLLLLLIPLTGDRIQSQDGSESADTLFFQALNAQNAENWDRAIELYSRGSGLYPQDTRFPWSLGSLYYSRGLYNLAWDEFRSVERITPNDPDLLYRLSRTAGHLNRDALSVVYLERLLIFDPDSPAAIGDLAWMYYKLHRLAEGEALLLSALERFGPDMNFSMTLGTVYSDMFRYGDSKERYLEAIAEGEETGDRVFTAVANYNLSILETRFYRFADAYERTNASLAAADRASGRLARGELFLRRLDFPQAFIEYGEAYERDRSPLSKISLAQAYRIAGRLEEARLYAEDSLSSNDLSWMINYGINPNRYKRDIHEILYDSYRGLAESAAFKPYTGFGEGVKNIFRGVSYRFKAEVNKLLFQKYSLIAADAYAAQGQTLDALSNYYTAFAAYPRRGLTYLRGARDFEVPLIPESAPSYELEEGRLLKKTAPAEAALVEFDSLWERDMIAEAYRVIARHAAGRDKAAVSRDAAERLYALNAGALRQHGIAFPVGLTVDSGSGPRSAERRLVRALSGAGFDIRPSGEAPRFRLTVTLQGTEALCELFDAGRGISAARHTIPAGDLSSKAMGRLAENLGNLLFTAR